MTAPELKPCPFCGGKAHLNNKMLDERYGYAMQYEVQCKNCYIGYSFQDDQNPKGGYALDGTGAPKAIAAWNRRADLAAVQPAQVRVKPLVWTALGANGRVAHDELFQTTAIVTSAERAVEYEEERAIRILAVIEPLPDQTVEIDLRVAMMEELEKAASESPWVPKEYYMNEVISDCCAFLREDRTPQPDPRDEVIARLVGALEEIASITVHSGGDVHGVTSRKWQGAFQQAQDEASAALAAAKAVQK